MEMEERSVRLRTRKGGTGKGDKKKVMF